MINNSLYINSIESLAALDGEGVRVAIFLQGCPLRCIYCHNPETWQEKNCAKTTIKEIYKKILSYTLYFKNGGGVTFSGGEPLLQSYSLIKLCKKLKRKNINIALDTSGCLLNKNVLKLLTFVDHIILDLKFNTEEKYKKYCNGSLKQTLGFLNVVNNLKIKTWIRTVIIPKINDSENEIKKYKKLIENFDCVKKYELLGFHTMGFEKYKKLNIKNRLIKTTSLPEKTLKVLQSVAEK